MIEVVKIEDALGYPLAHDITEIRQGEFKGPAFLKGQIIEEKDFEHLRRLGKNHLYILKTEPEEMHEDEAAVEIANALSGPGVGWEKAPREGKITLEAKWDGLLKVDVKTLLEFNMIGDVMCATLHSNTIVHKGRKVAATRAIPLVVGRDKVENAVTVAKSSPQSVLKVLPLMKAKAGVMITGNEVYYGIIEDKFEKIIRKKVSELGGEILEVVFLPDDEKQIAEAAVRLVDKGANIVLSTGGMSVDPDDRTRHGMARAGVEDIVYGSAVLPGAMFMAGYLKSVPVLATPACGMYANRTVLDLILPRVLAGERITRREIAMLGHGGLCLNCKVCTFPRCPFGK